MGKVPPGGAGSRYRGRAADGRVGVLALQGDFREHVELLERLGASACEVRLPADLPR